MAEPGRAFVMASRDISIATEDSRISGFSSMSQINSYGSIDKHNLWQKRLRAAVSGIPGVRLASPGLCWRGTVKGFRYSWREAGPLGSNHHGARGHVRAFLSCSPSTYRRILETSVAQSKGE